MTYVMYNFDLGYVQVIDLPFRIPNFSLLTFVPIKFQPNVSIRSCSKVSHLQGMSDLLSPLLFVMKNEVDAFWCFVGFMDRVASNFEFDQVACNPGV